MTNTTSSVKDIICGGFGGLCAVTTGQPLDTIKVRLQTQPKPAPGQRPLYSGTWNCAIKTIHNESFLGLYKGMAFPLMGATPIFAISFFGYGTGKRLQQKNPEEPPTSLQIFNAGMLAAVFITPITTPLERVKCLLQVQAASKGPKLYSGPIDVVKVLYREGGIRSMYKGVCITLVRDMPTLGMYFLTYETLKRLLAPKGKAKELSPLRIIIAGGVAGMCSWSMAIAPDMLKSRLQTAPEGKYPNGIRSVIMDMVRNERPSALFKGAAPVLIRAFPANAACFLGFEAAMKFLNYIAPNL